MTITHIRIFPYYRSAESALKATATVVLNGVFILQGIRITTSRNDESRLSVVYPSRTLERGGSRICYFPGTEDARLRYEEVILSAYAQYLENPEVTSFELSKMEDLTFHITDATIYPVLDPAFSVRAKVRLELDGELVLKGMTLQAREDGSLWLRMPHRELKNGQKMDLYHPLTNEAREALTSAMLPFYDEAVLQAKKAAAAANFF